MNNRRKEVFTPKTGRPKTDISIFGSTVLKTMLLRQTMGTGMGIADLLEDVTYYVPVELQEVFNVEEEIECIECKEGVATVIGKSTTIKVKASNGAVIDLMAFEEMFAFEQALWATLFINGKVKPLFARGYSDINEDWDTLLRFNPATHEYEAAFK